MNDKLISELLEGGLYADQQGYWKCRNFESFPGWHKLPFSDFFENLSEQNAEGHKKMWLNPDGTLKPERLTNERQTLLPLYKGIVQTMRDIVSTSFFMYSAAIVSMHLNLAKYSRKYNVPANMKSIVAVASPAVVKELNCRAAALRTIAFVGYEGDGLGGYKPKSWLFWGRLLGKTAPTDSLLLTEKKVKECQKAFHTADLPGKQRLFISWWNEVHPGYDPMLVSFLCNYYLLVRRYKRMESPTCPKKQRFNPKSNFDIQSALCGFFRRSSVGLGEAQAYDINDLDKPAHRFSDMLFQVDLSYLLTGHDGEFTAFGEYIDRLLDIYEIRNELVDRITARQTLSQDKQAKLSKLGYKSRLSKRGRARV